ncbi:MAG: Uma2 family endonuclease [Cyanobacteria bacterium P01_G01_bin.38]
MAISRNIRLSPGFFRLPSETDDIFEEPATQSETELPAPDAPLLLKQYSCEDYIREYYNGTDTRYELKDGYLRVLSNTSFKELLLTQFLKKEIDHAIDALEKPWQCLFGAGLRTGWRQVRQPHICVIRADQQADMISKTNICQTPPFLVVEIVTPEAVSTTYRHKRSEYAALGVPEYWIVDPVHVQVVILLLEEGLYSDTVYSKDTVISSHLFPNLKLDPEMLMAAGAIS